LKPEVLHIVVPGECPPAPRPRFRVMPIRPLAQVKRARSMSQVLSCFAPRPYTPKGDKYAAWKILAAPLMKDASSYERRGDGPVFPVGTPVEVKLLVVTRLPKSETRKTEAKRPGRRWQISLRAGDPDNVAKGPLDAAKGILWADDTQVAALSIEQIVGCQGEEPRCEILVRAFSSTPDETSFENCLRAVQGTPSRLYSLAPVDLLGRSTGGQPLERGSAQPL
jgi:Holliday junction resolvase RusA-like endonuclease